MSQPILPREFVEWLTKRGWVWATDKVPGMGTLIKGDFFWHIPVQDYDIFDLVQAVEHEALNRGIKHAKAEMKAQEVTA